MSPATPPPSSDDPNAIEPTVLRSIEFSISGTCRENFPTDGLPQVAFVGRSNVGKSSLLNLLANRRQLAHVSRTPGRTQLVNFFKVNEAGYFVDLPGYGFASAPKSVKAGWDKMISGILTGNPYLRGVCVLLDVRREGPTPDDRVMLEWLHHHGNKIIAVLTKCDKLNRSEMGRARRLFEKELRGLPIHTTVETSADSRIGREQLLEIVFELLWPRIPAGPIKAVGAAKDLEEKEKAQQAVVPGEAE